MAETKPIHVVDGRICAEHDALVRCGMLTFEESMQILFPEENYIASYGAQHWERNHPTRW